MVDTVESSATDIYIISHGTCGCAACASGVNNESNIIIEDGPVSAPGPEATVEQFSDYLINGFWSDFGTIAREWQDPGDITFSFSKSRFSYGF